MPWIVWIAVSLFLNFDVGAGLYSSQLLLVLWGLCWTVLQLYKFDIAKAWIFLSFIAFTAWSFLIQNSGGSGRFLPEFGKVVIIALSFVIFRDLKVEAHYDSITLAFPILTSALALLTRLFGDWDTYDPVLHRLGVPQLGGSPNTAAFVFAFCLLLIHYQWMQRRGWAVRAVLAVSYLILMYAMFASQSRGGLLMYVAGVIFFLSRRWRLAALVVIGIGLVGMTALSFSPQFARFNLLMDARDTGGTGRAVIWAELIGNMLQNPVRILWGNGPGAVNFYLFGVYPIQSGHSMYVEILYAYGLIGIALLITWFTILYRAGISRTQDPRRRKVNMAIWFALLFGFAMDSDPLAAQVLWLTPLLGALMIAGSPHHPVQTGSQFAVNPQPLPGNLDCPEISL